MSTPDDISTAAGRRTRQPVYHRGPAGQEAFEAAAARLRAQDSWLNQRTGERELNADLVLEGGGSATGFIIGHAAAGHLPRSR